MDEPRLVIFARRPVAGEVKTRLGRQIGARRAADVYRQLLFDVTGRLIAERDWRTILAVTPDEAAVDPGPWPVGPDRAPQGVGDLGRRMMRFLQAATTAAPVVVVGSDIPELSPADVHQAFDALRACDLVVGPAVDGGYWLIGASRPPDPALFSGVRWSSPDALADTLANAGAASVGRLRRLEDVDDEASWRRWLAKRRARTLSDTSPSTAAPTLPERGRRGSGHWSAGGEERPRPRNGAPK